MEQLRTLISGGTGVDASVLAAAAALGVALVFIGLSTAFSRVIATTATALMPEGLQRMNVRVARERQINRDAIAVGVAVAVGAAAIIYFLFQSILFAVACALLGVPAGYFTKYKLKEKLLQEIDLQLPIALQLFASSFRAGRNLLDCIQDVADNGPKPVSEEFGQLADEAAVGGVSSALRVFRTRLNKIRSVRTMTSVMLVAQDYGGDMGEAATELAATFREVHKLEAKTRTATQQTRAAMNLVSAAPIVILLMLSVFQPESVSSLFGTAEGWVTLGIAVALYVVAIIMMRRLMQVKI